MDKRPLRTTRRLSNLQRAGWYKVVRNATGPARVSVYDEIGMFGVSAQDFVNELGGLPGDIELHVNSPGGDVFDGIAIYNALRQHPGTVSIVVDGLAASAASFICQAASPGELAMAPHSQLMIHDGFGMAIGNAADMREMAGLLDKASDNIASIYSDRTGQPAETWRTAMRTETWYSDREAVDAGLADKILGEEAPGSAWDLSVYNGPGGQPKQLGDGWVQDPDGKVRFDPDGDGDDDSTPEGDKDHDYWDADGKQIKPIPPKPKAKPDQTGQYGQLPRNAKYNQDDRDRMAKNGQAMEDGSYPIADAEDLDNAIHAVGRGGSGHDAIRRHITKRAKALGLSSRIPDNWGGDGSMASPSSQSDEDIWAELAVPELFRLDLPEGSK